MKKVQKESLQPAFRGLLYSDCSLLHISSHSSIYDRSPNSTPHSSRAMVRVFIRVDDFFEILNKVLSILPFSSDSNMALHDIIIDLVLI